MQTKISNLTLPDWKYEGCRVCDAPIDVLNAWLRMHSADEPLAAVIREELTQRHLLVKESRKPKRYRRFGKGAFKFREVDHY